MLNIPNLFLNFFEVAKTFSQLLFGASLSAKDMLCCSMLEISVFHVTSEILQLFLANICPTRHVFLRYFV